MLLEHLDVQLDEPGGQVVVHQGHRLAVGHPDPLQRHDQGPLRQLQRVGDLVAGMGDLRLEHAGGRVAAAGREVVVEAGELDVAVDPLVGDQGPGTALADHEPLVRQVQEGRPHRGPGQAEHLRQLDLVLQPGADLERTGSDRRFEMLSQLEVQRHRAGPVDGDRAAGAWFTFGHRRHPGG